MKYRILFFLFLVLVIGNLSQSDSLWKENSKSPYVRNNPLKVGDLITIQIVEATTALQQAQTDLSKKSDVNMDMLSSWEKIANMVSSTEVKGDRFKEDIEVGGGDSYKGKGQTTRKSSLKAKITVQISRVIDGSMFEIEGTHQVKVNDELEKIYIRGLIRKQDVSIDNTINSNQIANAQISLEGNGAVSSKQNPGVLTRLFGWLF